MLPAEPKAEADNTCHDLDYSGYHKKIGLITCHCWENEPALIQPRETAEIEPNKKNESYCFIVHCLNDENNDRHTIARNRIDIVLGNHALHMQPTD